MQIITSDDGLITKYIHTDNSETTIKSVPSCSTVTNTSTGQLDTQFSDKNKYSVFISHSTSCPFSCSFCYLTLRKMPYKKLSRVQIVNNAKEAILHSITQHPELKTKYIKLCWMGMGEAILTPKMVTDITLNLLLWVTTKGYAKGLDGVDLSTILPSTTNIWMNDWSNEFVGLNNRLSEFDINPHNNVKDRSRFRLFYSLHSAVNDTRDKMIPNSLSVTEACNQLHEFSPHNNPNIIIHHMFISNSNDSDDEIRALIDLIEQYNLNKFEFRILRYNNCEPNNPVESDKFDAIVQQLSEHHHNIKIQVSPGSDMSSACGQFLTPSMLHK